MFTFRVAAKGATETVDNLTGVADRVLDIEPFLEVVHATFLLAERARFEAEGPGWAPLAEATLANKDRHGWPAHILVASGELEASLTDDGAAGNVWEPAPDGAEMGTDYRSPTQGGEWADTALGAFHQEGTTRMPARPIIDVSDKHIAGWTAALADWILGATTDVPAVP